MKWLLVFFSLFILQLHAVEGVQSGCSGTCNVETPAKNTPAPQEQTPPKQIQTTNVDPLYDLSKNDPYTCDDSDILKTNGCVLISVIGQGVAPCNGTCSPAQAYVLAKRAAVVDAYRLIAEKVRGVYIEGQDYVENMMVKKSRVRTFVSATIRRANIIDTKFQDGLCEVEMEIRLYHKQLVNLY
jgi:hypothetical protein